jgi:hypothetical protein
MVGLKTNLIDAFGLGIGFWLMGYIAGIILYFIVSADILGWIIFIIFAPITSYLAYLRFRKRSEPIGYYLIIGAIWAFIAIILDYIFIVMAFNSKEYYKLDVFAYYLAMFVIPLLIGWMGRKRK